MRTCGRCKQKKNVSEFCKRKDTPSGYDYRCRSCEAKRRAEYTSKHIEAERERSAKYARKKRILDPDAVNAALKRWRDANPDKSRGKTARRRKQYPEMASAGYATVGLRMEGKDAHHWSYEEQHFRSVIFLTRTQHSRLHRLIKYDQPLLKFRIRTTGRVLATKTEHLQYILDSGILTVPELEELVDLELA